MIPTPHAMWTSSDGSGTISFVEVGGHYEGKRQYVVFIHSADSGLMWEAKF
jgi:hypothetical protein